MTTRSTARWRSRWYRPIWPRNAASRERFLREAKLAAGIDHENVVTIYSINELGSTPFFVMQLVEGRTLQSVIDELAPLDETQLRRIATEAASGLRAAHRKGVIHRDIKPANILIEHDTERVLLTDFGLAKARDDVHLTRDGMTPGTPIYMSPEQAKGESVDERSDLFSLGTVLYTAATGTCPFEGDSVYATIKNVCESEMTPIRELNPSISTQFEKVVSQLMEKSAAQRIPSADETPVYSEERPEEGRGARFPRNHGTDTTDQKCSVVGSYRMRSGNCLVCMVFAESVRRARD